ncbi:MAG: HAMP domain-containing histidine kinase [Clostridia bacterium]|nr:HAMP domain-containing histidine kinase [Clostridia bacterium]
MRRSLFWRTYSVLLAALLVTIAIFTGVLTASRQQAMQESYENEVRRQAREVADYMANLSALSFLQSNATMRQVILRKIANIYNAYNADIWIVSYDSGTVQYLDSSWNTTRFIAADAVREQLALIQEGNEIRAEGLFPELEKEGRIVTIGVPWYYGDYEVVGAVLLHIPTASLKVGLGSVARQILPPALLALALGTILAFFLARSQIRPLREMSSAVQEFTKGDLTRRVDIHCGGELEELGDSINRMAGELSRLEDSRRSFVANVSHELRSPITCMRGYVQAMQDGVIDAGDMPRYLQIVLDETDRLTALVNDLLDLSRLESGKFPLTLAPFDANELMRRNLVNFEPRIDAKGIAVSVELAEGPLTVLADANRINQVVSNIIDNAVKFMDGEGSRLTVRTAREGKNVRFTIANNGPRIAENDLPYIFERFYKADKAHTSGGGTGLGLSICQRIMQQHGSKIEVRSDDGETAFEFVLPMSGD